MEKKSVELIAAEWLIVGFIKGWSWKMLKIQIETVTKKEMDFFGFFPSGLGFSNWKGTAPVRAYVYQNWPNLADYIDSAPIEKKLQAANEVVKLKWSGKLSQGAINKIERSEIEKTKKDLDMTITMHKESRKNFKSQKSQWNVCK